MGATNPVNALLPLLMTIVLLSRAGQQTVLNPTGKLFLTDETLISPLNTNTPPDKDRVFDRRTSIHSPLICHGGLVLIHNSLNERMFFCRVLASKLIEIHTKYVFY